MREARISKLYHSISKIDSRFIEEAQTEAAKKRSPWIEWLKLGAAAACLCLAVIGVFNARRFAVVGTPADTAGKEHDSAQTAVDLPVDATAEDGPMQGHDSVAYGFHLNGDGAAAYYPISFDERVRYGLVPGGAAGLNESNLYQITEEDLGEPMGTVTYCGDEAVIGSPVYHFAKYPDYDSICIADTPYGYDFYVCNWLDVPVEIGGTPDTIFKTYALPGSMAKMEILAPDFQPLSEVEGEAAEAILEILSGKVNHGHEANERRFAQAWYDAYGNDGIHYSEEYGHCVAREIDLWDKAHALWNEGERIIRITTNRGFWLTVDYFPAVGVFACGDGYYGLSAGEVDALSALLQA